MKKLFARLMLLLVVAAPCYAQQYTGMNGLIHVPSAEMDTIENLRIGVHALPKRMMPNAMMLHGEKYASSNWYISAMPLKWMEVGYSFTLMKFYKNLDPRTGKEGFYSKDRYFSLRLRPLCESRYLPAFVVGCNDLLGQKEGNSNSFYFRNFYVAASKHFPLSFGEVGTHLVYRKWVKSYNSRWNGVVGGITFRPAFFNPLRLIAEYNASGINIGADCVLLRYLLLQAALIEGREFSVGAAVRIELRD